MFGLHFKGHSLVLGLVAGPEIFIFGQLAVSIMLFFEPNLFFFSFLDYFGFPTAFRSIKN